MRPQGWETSVKLGGIEQTLEGRSPMKSGGGRRSSLWSWRWSDRLVLLCAWTAGLGLCAIAAAIVIYMGYRGVEYLAPVCSLRVPRSGPRRPKPEVSSIH